MSTILKALDRLDHEKEVENRERPLREEVSRRHNVAPSKGRSRRGILIGAGAGVAVLAIGITFLLSSSQRSAPEGVRAVGLPAPLAAVAAPRLSKPETEPAPTPEAAPVPRSVREAPPEERVRELPPSALASEVAVIEPSSRALPMDVPRTAPVRTAERSLPPASTTLSRATTPTVQSHQPEEIALGSSKSGSPQARSLHFESSPASLRPAPGVHAAPSDTARALPQVAAAPIPVAEVPIPAAQASAPTMRDVRVARTIWHPTAERRFAYVEVSGQVGPLRVREGDSVGRLTVGKIEPWGVIFLDDGVEIRQRVGASR